jgi:phospholipid N-methyltransferase
VSGLPFASLPVSSAGAIVEAIVGSLRAGGTFTTFQYLHAYGFASAVTVRQTLTREMGSSPARTLVLGNLPPALVLRWRKHR